ncbi:hypothetical protein [Oceanisphaera psychrotolerans]|jgi:hypothetical protein|uniref:Uncharacterized protein n=1 Tax=Oceanisphaera psychrotolerans TaxID=1414654 RepID=A0A1J4QH46_9GAMM|nr:hypothetical protein [Oceanisphaera psychrotolerans]OIN12274.1 hypothetical protein BFR47_00850 [Oceanisphaera psychrotolerans]
MIEESTLDRELTDKLFWLRKFRMAKNDRTLELMVSKAVDNHHTQSAVVAAIYLAECQREREMQQGRFLDQ